MHFSLIKRYLNKGVSSAGLMLFAIYAFAFFYLLILSQSFLFSDDFATSWVRQIDDATYHEDLRRIHLDFKSKNWADLFRLNNNGYGWIFWIIYGVFTYPFYKLSQIGIVEPLIVSGRLMGWILTVSTIFLIYKIILKLTNNKFISFISILTFGLFPHVIMWSMRFTSDTLVVLLVVASFYFTLIENIGKKLRFILVTSLIGAAVGAKMTSGIVLPLIYYSYFAVNNRPNGNDDFSMSTLIVYNYINTESLKFLLTFSLFAVFFLNPAFYIYSLDPSFSNYTIDTIKVYASLNYDVGDSNIGILEILNNSLSKEYLGFYSILTSFLLMSSCLILRNIKKYGLILVAFSVLVVSFIGLALVVKKGLAYIGVYYFPVAFLFLMVFVCISATNQRLIYKNILTFSIFLLFIFESRVYIYEASTSYLRYRTSPHIISMLDFKETLKLKAQYYRSTNEGIITSLVDYRAIFPYTTLDNGFKTIALLDDLSVRKKWSAAGYDFIVVSKNNPIADLSDAAPAIRNTTMSILDESKYDYRKLYQYGYINNEKYTIILENQSMVAFSRDSTKIIKR